MAKTTLFLTGGLIEHTGGRAGCTRLGGMVRHGTVLAVLFLVPALSLAGLPPLSGFVAKLALVDAAAAEVAVRDLAVSLVVSLLTLFSMMKIWTRCSGPRRPSRSTRRLAPRAGSGDRR